MCCPSVRAAPKYQTIARYDLQTGARTWYGVRDPAGGGSTGVDVNGGWLLECGLGGESSRVRLRRSDSLKVEFDDDLSTIIFPGESIPATRAWCVTQPEHLWIVTNLPDRAVRIAIDGHVVHRIDNNNPCSLGQAWYPCDSTFEPVPQYQARPHTSEHLEWASPGTSFAGPLGYLDRHADGTVDIGQLRYRPDSEPIDVGGTLYVGPISTSLGRITDTRDFTRLARLVGLVRRMPRNNRCDLDECGENLSGDVATLFDTTTGGGLAELTRVSDAFGPIIATCSNVGDSGNQIRCYNGTADLQWSVSSPARFVRVRPRPGSELIGVWIDTDGDDRRIVIDCYSPGGSKIWTVNLGDTSDNTHTPLLTALLAHDDAIYILGHWRQAGRVYKVAKINWCGCIEWMQTWGDDRAAEFVAPGGVPRALALDLAGGHVYVVGDFVAAGDQSGAYFPECAAGDCYYYYYGGGGGGDPGGPGGSASLSTDSFTGPNGQILGAGPPHHAPESGPGWTLGPPSGPGYASLQGGRLYTPLEPIGEADSWVIRYLNGAVTGAGQSQVSIEFEGTPVGNPQQAGILCRLGVGLSTSGYVAVLETHSGGTDLRVSLYDLADHPSFGGSGGMPFPLATASVGVTAGGTLTVHDDGAWIGIDFNGVRQVTYQSTDHTSGSRRQGLFAYGQSGVYFDDWKVRGTAGCSGSGDYQWDDTAGEWTPLSGEDCTCSLLPPIRPGDFDEELESGRCGNWI